MCIFLENNNPHKSLLHQPPQAGNGTIKMFGSGAHGKNSLSHPKKDREAFRHALVNIIMCAEFFIFN